MPLLFHPENPFNSPNENDRKPGLFYRFKILPWTPWQSCSNSAIGRQTEPISSISWFVPPKFFELVKSFLLFYSIFSVLIYFYLRREGGNCQIKKPRLPRKAGLKFGIIRASSLPLSPLRSTAGALQARFLSFFSARVASDKTSGA